MSNRIYRALVGALLLVALYLDQTGPILALVALMLFEGVTNLRLTRWWEHAAPPEKKSATACEVLMVHRPGRFDFEAERAWRLVVPVMLLLSLYPFGETLWFFPWFMGFAILGAGLSDVCPVLLLLRYLGFR